MSQYVEGGAVAPRPVLEIVKQPFYDYVLAETNAGSDSLFAMPVGAADAGAANGANKTFSDTNMRRAGALATPQQYDIYAISLKYPPAISRADLNMFQTQSNLDISIGQKSYLRVKLDCIPSDVTTVVDALTVAADAVHVGWPLHSNVFDVSIPEELFDPSTGRTFLTGRRVPIHIPSEQQFFVTLENIGTFTLGASRRIGVMLWGCWKREVQ